MNKSDLGDDFQKKFSEAPSPDSNKWAKIAQVRKAKKSKPTGIVTIRGRIEKIYYNNGKFAAGRVKTAEGDTVGFSGPIYVRENEIIVWKGEWNCHPQYGWQFKVSDPIYEQALDVEGLAHYLANNRKMKGLGPVKAQKIASAFGTEFDKIINEEPEKIQKLAGLSPLMMANLRDEWNARRDMNSALTELSKYGLTHHQITQLTKKFGQDSTKILKDNPYLIQGQVDDFGFKRIDAMATKVGIKKTADCRLRAGIMHCVNTKLDEGDCWIEFQDLIAYSNKELILDDLDSKKQIEAKIEELVKDGKLANISIDGRSLIAIPSIYKIECDLANWFTFGSLANPHFAQAKNLEQMIATKFPTLNSEQREAMLSAFKYRQVLISGAGGTGKSFTTAAICDVYESMGLKVKLTSPTGKASKRLAELSGREALTIHRLIGLAPTDDIQAKSNRSGDEPVDADLIIVDESSMIPIKLAWELFKALDLNRTCLVFLGDHHQLAPVGAGNILRDLVERRPIPAVILKQVVRQAGLLCENSFKVLQGEVPETTTVADQSGRKPWYLVKIKDRFGEDSAENLQKTIVQMYEEYLQDQLGFDLINDIQLLSPKKAGLIGTEQMNITLQKVIQKKLYNFEVPPIPAGEKPKFYVNDRVIQVKRNNYDLDIMNGEMGIVKEINGKNLIIRFPDKKGFREVPLDVSSKMVRDHLELAYCLTFHKMQGSEIRCAIVIIHKSHMFQHDRSLFYTGVSRAKETAIIIGDAYGMKNCAETQKSISRRTFLSVLPFKKPVITSLWVK
jgi:exodeoxyribonuclease V alpha subunit